MDYTAHVNYLAFLEVLNIFIGYGNVYLENTEDILFISKMFLFLYFFSR